jgi:predicted DCC family thiol-disulfide oxidoreductase YuxK
VTKPYSWRSDPAVPAFPDEHPLIVFDGECVLCSANARFVLRHDKSGSFRLTTAQGVLGQALYRHFGLGTSDYETMLVLEAGRLLTESDAALAIARGLGWPWRSAGVFRLVPRRVRNGCYRLVARNRFRLWGRRQSCFAPAAGERDRMV